MHFIWSTYVCGSVLQQSQSQFLKTLANLSSNPDGILAPDADKGKRRMRERDVMGIPG